MLETELKRIADALEKIAATLEGGAASVSKGTHQKPAAKEEKAAPAKEEKKAETAPPAEEETAEVEVPDLDTVVKALQAYMQANGRDAAVELLTRYGAKKASDIPEDKRAAFVKDAS